MRHSTIEFRGIYHYRSTAHVERALAAARAQIADDDHADLEPDWTRAFVQRGATLLVEVDLPPAGDEFLAATVVATLAATAIDGAVEARRDGRCLDWFASGDEV